MLNPFYYYKGRSTQLPLPPSIISLLCLSSVSVFYLLPFLLQAEHSSAIFPSRSVCASLPSVSFSMFPVHSAVSKVSILSDILQRSHNSTAHAAMGLLLFEIPTIYRGVFLCSPLRGLGRSLLADDTAHLVSLTLLLMSYLYYTFAYMLISSIYFAKMLIFLFTIFRLSII